MNRLREVAAAMAAVAALLAPASLAAGTEPIPLVETEVAAAGRTWTVRVPQGHRLDLLAAGLQRPRLITFAPDGALFMGSRSGSIYRSPPPYGRVDEYIRLDGYPHSVAFRDGEILIARTDGLYRAPWRAGEPRLDPARVELLAGLPASGGHSSRTVRIGPDRRVYMGIGLSANCPNEYLHDDYPFERRRGGVLVLREEGGRPRWETFASGLRNPVGFDWQPATGVLFASNNGPDHHGFEQPPEYFARLDPGSFHGMPWYQYDGRRVERDRCIRGSPPRPPGEVAIPAALLPSRNAPMAVAFVPPGAVDARLAGDAVIALRGSWGTRPDGRASGDPATRREPGLVAVRFDGQRVARVDDLVRGFQLADGTRWARPVGVAVGPDGALYFTSDEGINGLFRLRRITN